MRTQHISLPHTQTHIRTRSDRDSYTIAGDRNQAVPVLSDQNVMMLWIPQIPKWSGLFLAIDECCRQLPNSSPKCNKTKSMICHYAHEVIQREKEPGSQMKGMQRKSETRDGCWICQSSDTQQILTARHCPCYTFVRPFTVCWHHRWTSVYTGRPNHKTMP